MNVSDFESLAAGIESIVTMLALFAAGAWALRRFVIYREASPRIEFDVSLSFVGVHRDNWLVEVAAKFENKGLVRHKISALTYRLHCLFPEDSLDGSALGIRQGRLPRCVEEGSWLFKNGYIFLEPGTKSVYVSLAQIPKQATIVEVCGRFNYEQSNEFFTADNLLKVPSEVATAVGVVSTSAPNPTPPTEG